MKILRNRKLFGILNVLDIFIIIFILAIIIPAIHYYIKFNEKGFAEQKTLERYLKRHERSIATYHTRQEGTTELHVSFKDLTKEKLEKIKVHDKENLPDGTTIAEIVWVGEPGVNYDFIETLRLGKDDYSRMIKEGGYSLPARLKVKGFINNGSFYYKAQALDVLTRCTFAAGDYTVDFVIEMFPYKKIK